MSPQLWMSQSHIKPLSNKARRLCSSDFALKLHIELQLMLTKNKYSCKTMKG